MSLTPRIDNLEAGKNRIINGNADFWQRGTEILASSNGADRLADRWVWGESGSALLYNYRRSTDTPTVADSGFKSAYSIELEVDTAEASPAAGALMNGAYRIEGYDICAIANKTVTLSFWVKSSVTGIYSVSFRSNAAANWYVTEYTIDNPNTWEKKEVTLYLDTDQGSWDFENGIGLEIRWVLMAGSNWHSSTNDTWTGDERASANQVNWAASPGNIFRISQVMLHEGDSAGTFNRAGRTIQEELAMCQRYYEKSYSLDLDPGSDITILPSRDGAALLTPMGGSPRDVVSNGRFVVEKRAVPFIRVWNINGTADQATLVNNSTTHIIFAQSLLDFTKTQKSIGSSVNGQPTSGTASYHFWWDADAEL